MARSRTVELSGKVAFCQHSESHVKIVKNITINELENGMDVNSLMHLPDAASVLQKTHQFQVFSKFSPDIPKEFWYQDLTDSLYLSVSLLC